MIAMIAVGVMQMTRHDIIDVIAVPDGLMAAIGAVAVLGSVLGTIVVRRAVVGIGVGNRNLADGGLALHVWLLLSPGVGAAYCASAADD